MRIMQRSKEEILKDEKLAGAVQVLPNDGLFKVVNISIFRQNTKISLNTFCQEKKEEKKEWESPEHAALREAAEKAHREMQELLDPANQDKSMRIKELMSF